MYEGYIQSENDQLRAIVRNHASAYRDVMRAKIVLLVAEGLCNGEFTAAQLGTSRQSVSR